MRPNNGRIIFNKSLYYKFNFQEMIAVADLDKNGKISLEEFTKLVKEPF